MVAKKIPKVVLDASALLCLCETKVDLFTDVEKELGTVNYIVPGSVMLELKRLAGKNKQKSKCLNLLLNIFNIKNVEIFDTQNSYADKDLIEMSADCFVTCDLELAKILKKQGKRVFVLVKGRFFSEY